MTSARTYRRTTPTRVSVIVPVFVALSGCIAPAPWPDPPSGEARTSAKQVVCPKIAGTYVNEALAGGSCTGLDEKACRSLAFYFFSAHVREAAGVSNHPTPSDDWPEASHVRIEQPTANELRIVALEGATGAQPQVLATKELHRKNGDFGCEVDLIRLRPRVEREAVLWMARTTRSEYLTFSADHNALAVLSTRQYEGYLMWVLGGTTREERSDLRWQRVK